MTGKKFIWYHKKVCENLQKIVEKKNNDYAGSEIDNDAFKNFKMVEQFGICSAEAGVLVRMTDKLARISTFVKDGQLKVKDESVKDTLDDLANYAIILRAIIDDDEKTISQKLL